MWLPQRQGRLNDTTQRVEHPNGIRTPWAANLGSTRDKGDGFHELRVANGEILHTMVKVAIGRVSCGHATTCAKAFFEHTDLMARLHQGTGDCDTGHAGANDSCVFHGLTLHPWRPCRTHGLSQ